jgi:hypothetical protein
MVLMSQSGIASPEAERLSILVPSVASASVLRGVTFCCNEYVAEIVTKHRQFGNNPPVFAAYSYSYTTLFERFERQL